MIKVKDLSYTVNKHNILKGVSFDISQETGVVGLIGPNGAGKTTLIKLLLGFIRPTSGKIDINSGAIGYCPDSPEFEGYLTGQEILKYTNKMRNNDENALGKTNEEIMNIIGLPISNKLSVNFSLGMKQRLGIGVSLIGNSKVLVYDEPTSALDPFGRKQIVNLIKLLGKEHLVIVSSHLLGDIEEIADYILALHNGKVIFSGEKKNFISSVDSFGEITLSSNLNETEISSLIKKAFEYGLDLRESSINTILHFYSRDYPLALEFCSKQKTGIVTNVSYREKSIFNALEKMIKMEGQIV